MPVMISSLASAEGALLESVNTKPTSEPALPHRNFIRVLFLLLKAGYRIDYQSAERHTQYPHILERVVSAHRLGFQLDSSRYC